MDMAPPEDLSDHPPDPVITSGEQAGAKPEEAFEVPAGLHEEQLCSVSYQRPVEGCPIYSEYLKEGDDAPGRRP